MITIENLKIPQSIMLFRKNTTMIHAFPGKYHIEHDIFRMKVDKANRRVIIKIDKINQIVKI